MAAGRGDAPGRTAATRRWALVSVLVVGGGIAALGLLARRPLVGLALAAVVVAVGLLAQAESRRVERRQQEAFVRDLGGSLTRVRELIDVEHVRQVRDRQGELHAVREVRRTVPQLSLLHAVEAVRSL